MKKIILSIGAVFLCTFVFTQVKNPVQWSFSSKKVNSTTYEVHMTAQIDNDWHIYSQTTPDGGPVATNISFTKNPLVTLTGTIKEVGKMEKHFEPLFGVDVKQFSGKVDFVQTITIRPGIKTSVNGTIEFMTCNDHECLPPKKQPFSVTLN